MATSHHSDYSVVHATFPCRLSAHADQNAVSAHFTGDQILSSGVAK